METDTRIIAPDTASTGEQEAETRTRALRRGAKSVKLRVRVPENGKACKISRHQNGCLRSVTRRKEYLAELDPERFEYESRKELQRQATDRHGRQFGDRMVDYALAIDEALGVLTPARRFRNGDWRDGYIVAKPEDFSHRSGSTHCTINLDLNRIAPLRERGKKRVRDGESAIESATGCATHCATESEPYCATEFDSECNSNAVQSTETIEHTGFAAEFSRTGVLSQSHESVDSVESVESRATGANPGSLRSPSSPSREEKNCSDLDQTQDQTPSPIAPSGENRQALTISDTVLYRLNGGGGRVLSPADTPEKVIAVVSDGAFTIAALRNYPHTGLLGDCCREAVLTMADENYRVNVSNARLMGLAMEFLRDKHGFDAPRGWVPAMRQLRYKSRSSGGR